MGVVDHRPDVVLPKLRSIGTAINGDDSFHLVSPYANKKEFQHSFDPDNLLDLGKANGGSDACRICRLRKLIQNMMARSTRKNGGPDLQAITIRSICGEEVEFLIEMCGNVEYVNEMSCKGKVSVDVKDQVPNSKSKEAEDHIYGYEHNDIRVHLLVHNSTSSGKNVDYVPDKRCKWKPIWNL